MPESIGYRYTYRMWPVGKITHFKDVPGPMNSKNEVFKVDNTPTSLYLESRDRKFKKVE